MLSPTPRLKTTVRGRSPNLELLALEDRQLRLYVLPGLAPIYQRTDRLDDFLLVCPHLDGAVTLAEGDTTVLDRLEIYGDAERGAKLVVSAVPLADGCAGGVDAAGDAGGPELLRQLADVRRKILVRGQRDDQDFGWCYGRGE